MSGLVLNGERPLDLAAERDPRVQLQGNVHLLMNLPKDLHAPPSDLTQWQRVSLYQPSSLYLFFSLWYRLNDLKTT